MTVDTDVFEAITGRLAVIEEHLAAVAGQIAREAESGAMPAAPAQPARRHRRRRHLTVVDGGAGSP
jgi:hypothetical protein